jgi:hypothetical protein
MLSIIVNHYKSPEVLKLCLRYLTKNAPEGCELIVTDSETTEKTRDMMRYEFPDILFLQAKENIGFAKSVNRGIQQAHGDFLLILNADAIVPNNEAIPRMLRYIEAHTDVGILGPKLLNINGEYQSSCFRFYSPRTILARRTPFGKTSWGKRELSRFLIHGGLPPEKGPAAEMLNPVSVDWIMGSAMLVRRAALQEVGPMSEDYFMYFEDVDWCRSFWEKGWKVIYYPGAFLYHYHFQSSKKRGAILDALTNKYARIHLLSAIKYFKKYGLKIPRYGV